MKVFFLYFVTFCICLWTINSSLAQTAKCDYSYQYYWTTGYKTTNVSYYRCDLDTTEANYNEKLKRIDGQHLTGQSDADVKCIGTNKIQTLKTFSSIFCQKFPNIEVIDIDYTEVESIDEDSLANCKNLDRLILYGNIIREIPENLLIQNSKLTYFQIDNNQLTTLSENLFPNQKELEQLYLNENHINLLPSNIFRPLVRLEVLYLNNNKLQSINSEWFVTLHNLKRLELHGNQISEIQSKCFAALKSLENLWLYGNKIKTLNSESFDGLLNLHVLSLQNNEISDLPVGVLAQLKNLQELYLFSNKLTTIHSDSFGIHNQLTKVYLKNNKINEIDPKLIDNIAVSTLNMKSNICSQLLTTTRSEIKSNLKKCYDNYNPRPQSQTQISSSSKDNSCGKSKTGRSNIIGGTHIDSGDYPWIAALVTPAGKFFCGGTLVFSQKVVTAAHCIQDKKSTKRLAASDLIVLLGMHDLNKYVEIGRVPYAVYSINVHPDWNTLLYAFDADIAVLVLETEVTFNQYVQPICLPEPYSNIATIQSGSVVGYGKSEDDTKEHENIPKIIETPIHSNDDCFKANEDLNPLSSGRTFCGGSGKGIGVCKGDSGSGLIVSDGSAYYLRGIVSSSIIGGRYGCDVDNYAVFTDVLKYVDWINGIPIDRFAVRTKK